MKLIFLVGCEYHFENSMNLNILKIAENIKLFRRQLLLLIWIKLLYTKHKIFTIYPIYAISTKGQCLALLKFSEMNKLNKQQICSFLSVSTMGKSQIINFSQRIDPYCPHILSIKLSNLFEHSPLFLFSVWDQFMSSIHLEFYFICFRWFVYTIWFRLILWGFMLVFKETLWTNFTLSKWNLINISLIVVVFESDLGAIVLNSLLILREFGVL